jgi:hypothetical protein
MEGYEMKGKVGIVLPAFEIEGKDGSKYMGIHFQVFPDDGYSAFIKDVVFKCYKGTASIVKNLRQGDHVHIKWVPESRINGLKIFNDHKAFWVERIQ